VILWRVSKMDRNFSPNRERRTQSLAIIALLVVGAMAIAGPTGFSSWMESRALLEKRQVEISKLEAENASLSNQVALLDPEQADPDFVGELLRSNLNVTHPDDVVIILDR